MIFEFYIFYNDGSSYPNASSADVTITGVAPGELLGWAIRSGDLDADGDDDLVASSYLYSTAGESNAGRISIYYNDGSYSSSMTISAQNGESASPDPSI